MLPTPAMPANSVTSAPMQAMNNAPADTSAHRSPKVARISAPWPRWVNSPSRTVISWTRYKMGINNSSGTTMA